MGLTSFTPQPVLTPPDYEALFHTAQRRFERERRARQQAEIIAENGLRALHQRERHAALLETIARSANSSASMTIEAVRTVLSAICDHTGWVCAFVYLPRTHCDGNLTTSPHYLVIGEGLDAFIDATLERKTVDANDLAGRVVTLQHPVWIPDVASDDCFLRRDLATACGLRAGIAFPVLIDGSVAAVFEFFAREAQEPDPTFVAILESVGTQLGRVVERERHQARLVHDATHDALTGLPNRTLLLGRLSQRLSEARDDCGGFAILFIDLDRFKLVNDSLGHHAGDALLIEVATRFEAVLSTSGTGNLLARLGGDEFVVLADRTGDMEVASRLAERLLASLAVPVRIEGEEFYGAASIGVTCSSLGYRDAQNMLRDADIAMYEAKRAGKGRVGVFEPKLHLQAVTRMTLESDLRRAVRDRDFVVHYQPIVPLNDNGDLGFEALVRWQKSPGVLVPPGAFIGVAEETGLIIFIGSYVLREACRTVVGWNEGRPESDWVSVSVNVSARQLQQPEFVQTVRNALNESGAHPSTLRIELTESAAISDIKDAVAKLRSIRGLGVRVSIDDFGTGHSSLSYLNELTFDTVKIDRSFVHTLQEGFDKSEIVRTVLDLARKLGASVVAEGAETLGQYDELKRLGCEYVQGFIVSRPLDENAATSWLDARRLSCLTAAQERQAIRVAA